MRTIIGIKLEQREDCAVDLQKVATEFGCSIKTRIGLHDVSETVCSPCGLVLFEVVTRAKEFEQALKEIKGATVKIMEF